MITKKPPFCDLSIPIQKGGLLLGFVARLLTRNLDVLVHHSRVRARSGGSSLDASDARSAG